jgi:hypothetical protein
MLLYNPKAVPSLCVHYTIGISHYSTMFTWWQENATTLRMALSGLGSFGSGTRNPEWPAGYADGVEQPNPAGFPDQVQLSDQIYTSRIVWYVTNTVTLSHCQ